MALWIAAFFMNGNVFFAGFAVACAGIVLRLTSKGRRLRSVAFVATVLGVLLVAASGTPLPLWAYGVWGGLLALCAIAIRRAKCAALCAGLFCACSVGMAALELPYHLRPRIDVSGRDSLFVVGDSLSIGADTMEGNWPQLLGAKLGLPTRNLAFGGAKVETILGNAKKIDRDAALVLLEIGGNNLLANTRGFQAGLDRLLVEVCKGSRRVVMFELPLPPCYNHYGAVQRRLARAYGVRLIPKRYMTRVFAAPGATVDGLHLSNGGHALFADTVFALCIGAQATPDRTTSGERDEDGFFARGSC